MHFIERGDKVHLRRPRIGETDIHPTTNQRAHQAFCTVHGVLAPSFCRLIPMAHAQAHAHYCRGIVIKSFGEHNTRAGRHGRKPQQVLRLKPV